jgi:hypothetical protein
MVLSLKCTVLSFRGPWVGWGGQKLFQSLLQTALLSAKSKNENYHLQLFSFILGKESTSSLG